jgi:hypothetical protein
MRDLHSNKNMAMCGQIAVAADVGPPARCRWRVNYWWA